MKALKLVVLVCAFALMVRPLWASSFSPCGSVPGNLVVNCGFETGDFTGWALGGGSLSIYGYTYVVSGAQNGYSGANSGNYYAVMGPEYTDGTLSQTLSTSVGTDYTFAFYLASLGDSPSDFSAYWDGTQLLSLTNPNSSGAYILYTYSVTGTGSDTIQFDFQDDPNYLALDDISVSAVPEPGAFSLLFLGLGISFVGRQHLLARS
ncbi:MAG: hypothetical protein ABR991_11135 [Terracidiphilus sp.]